jgi:predicted transcriptional regulator
MSAVTVELPSDLRQRLEKIAEQEGISVSQLLIEAAEKMLQIETLEQIKHEAAKRDTRKAFEKFLKGFARVEPENPDDRILAFAGRL